MKLFRFKTFYAAIRYQLGTENIATIPMALHAWHQPLWHTAAYVQDRLKPAAYYRF